MMRLLLALSSLAAAARAQQVMSRRLLPDALVTGLGARCMDGSAGGYFVLRAAGANASKLVIFIEGGGECRTSEECVAWHGSHASNSSQWAPSRTPQPQSEMSTDCSENPDFCTWSKVFIPYCTGDMHSGQQTARNPALANYYYSGHLQIVGVAADLKASGAPLASPSHVLVVGSSAGGIGALMHTDFFAEQWPSAVVKGAPECGFFYAGVTAADDLSKGEATPAAHLGFTPEWKPYLPSACAAATGNNMSQCTDAHYLYPHLKQPIFIRENQYDTAKLANCGWDGSNAAYLKLWGEWMRAELGVIAQSPKDGFFSAACLEHGGNFGWASSPVINGVTMQAAMRNWYFELGNRSLHYTYDDCAESGGSGLPCTAVDAESQQRCPHWASSPGGGVSAQCLSELGKDCPGLRGKGQSCGQCVRAHAGDLKGKGCPAKFEPVYAAFCQTVGPTPTPPPPPAGGNVSATCLKVLEQDCAAVHGQPGEACHACITAHQRDLRGAGCPATVEPVVAAWCGGGVEEEGRVGAGAGAGAGGAGHHVCDLSISRRIERFGH